MFLCFQNLRLTCTEKLISYSFPALLSSHISSQHFPRNQARYFGIGLWGCCNFGQKDTFLIIVCPYWKLLLEAWALKWSCQNTPEQPYSWITFIFPLVHPCITSSGVFPLLHPVAAKVPIFFVSPPAVYMTVGDGILPLSGFFAVSWWWLSARLLHHFFPLSNIFEKGQAFPLCCCCHKPHSIGVFSSLSSQIHPIPSYYHSTLNRAKYPLSVQAMKSFILVLIFAP